MTLYFPMLINREAAERAEQEAKRLAELEKMLESQRLEHERAELETRRAEELRYTELYS